MLLFVFWRAGVCGGVDVFCNAGGEARARNVAAHVGGEHIADFLADFGRKHFKALAGVHRQEIAHVVPAKFDVYKGLGLADHPPKMDIFVHFVLSKLKILQISTFDFQ